MMMRENLAGPAYRIESRRVVVRCWQPTDVGALDEAIRSSLDHLRPWMPWASSEPIPREERLHRIRRWRGEFDLGVDYTFGIFDAAKGAVLGGTGLHVRAGDAAREIGYWIRAGFTGRGLATEVAGALTRVGFEVEGLDRVEIHCDPDNVASSTVARRLGYLHEATLRRRCQRTDGGWRDTEIWTMLRCEYPGSLAEATQARAFDALGRILM